MLVGSGAAHDSFKEIEKSPLEFTELRFLPPFSPDPDPIEQVFAKLKHWLWKAKVRDREKFWLKACGILESIEPDQCADNLRHAGYVATSVSQA